MNKSKQELFRKEKKAYKKLKPKFILYDVTYFGIFNKRNMKHVRPQTTTSQFYYIINKNHYVRYYNY